MPMNEERFWTEERREELDGMAPRHMVSVAYPKALPPGEGTFRERLQERIQTQWTRFADIVETSGFSELRAVRDHLAEQVAREERRKEKLEDQYVGEGSLASKSLGKEWKDAQQEWYRIKTDWDEHPAATAEYTRMSSWRQTYGTLQELKFLLSIAENVAWRYAVYGDDQPISVEDAGQMAEQLVEGSEDERDRADKICRALVRYLDEHNGEYPQAECGEPFNGNLTNLYEWGAGLIDASSQTVQRTFTNTGLLPVGPQGDSTRLPECLNRMEQRGQDIQEGAEKA
jgi:hypothetical protein